MTWRVMTWNIRGAAQPDLDRIAAAIREQRPDVVALQEVRRHQARAIAETLEWQHVWARKHYPFSPALWWLAEGLAIVAPHELTDRVARTLTPGAPTWTYRHRVVLAATGLLGAPVLVACASHGTAPAPAPSSTASASPTTSGGSPVDGTRIASLGDLAAAFGCPSTVTPITIPATTTP